jgi:hypothetical protein
MMDWIIILQFWYPGCGGTALFVLRSTAVGVALAAPHIETYGTLRSSIDILWSTNHLLSSQLQLSP